MSNLEMTVEDREAFLADVHVGVLSIARDGKGPLALPIWYQYEDGAVIISMSTDSAKAKLLRRYGRASMTVQSERAPYKYVMVEGPVTLTNEPRDVQPMATRYLGDELGKWYAEQNPPGDHTAVARLTPETWLTCDYGNA